MELHRDYDRTLWLVRHGESTWNSLRLVQGNNDDAILTEVGRRQAETMAMTFAGPVASLYSSDLRRARQTAGPLSRTLGLPLHADARLRERNLGICEGRDISVLTPEVTGILDGRVVDADARPEGGESITDLYERVGRFADELRALTLEGDDEGDVVVVAHGGSIRALRAYWCGIDPSDMEWDVVGNTSLWPLSLNQVASAVPQHSHTRRAS
jgi:2,3-bisphosphoglycerate-dependent phosphoglycerate mutase